MKKIITGICALAGTLSFAQNKYDYQYPSSAINLYSQDINSGNAKYIGVGGAVGALGSDINSVEQNPAGLGVSVVSDLQITAGVSSYNNKSSFGTNFKESDSKFNFQQFGGNFVFQNPGSDWNRFSIGVAYYNQRIDNTSAIGENSNISSVSSQYDGTFAGYYKNIDGYKSKFSLNFGSSYDDRLYLGLGLNFHETNYSSYEQYYEKDATDGKNYGYNLDGFPYNENGQGFSFSLGAIYKVDQSFRLGAAYHSPVWYSMETEYLGTNNSFRDDGTVGSYKPYYSDYDMTRGGRFVGSLGFVLAKSLSLGIDYTYHMNNDTKLKPNSLFTPSNNFINDFVKNSSEVRVVAEYRIEKFKVRAGYNYVASPFKDFSIDLANTNNAVTTTNLSQAFVGDVNRASFGVGYDFGGFYLDAAYQYQTQKYKQLIGGGNYIDSNNSYVQLPNTYAVNTKLNSNLFLLTLGWQF